MYLKPITIIEDVVQKSRNTVHHILFHKNVLLVRILLLLLRLRYLFTVQNKNVLNKIKLCVFTYITHKYINMVQQRPIFFY